MKPIKSVIDAVEVGKHLFVQGEVIFSKYDDDIVIDPRNINAAKQYRKELWTIRKRECRNE